MVLRWSPTVPRSVGPKGRKPFETWLVRASPDYIHKLCHVRSMSDLGLMPISHVSLELDSPIISGLD